MKKIYFVLAAFAALALASCNKELAPVQDVEVIDIPEVTISAVIDNTDTKTDYTISGNKALFSWSSGDRFIRLVRNSSTGKYDQYTAQSPVISADGYSAEFTSSAISSPWEDSGFALYPVSSGNGADLGYDKTGTDFYIKLNETLTYDAEHPLKGIVPMVGTLGEGDSYTFKPITGVIGIHATNIPAEATKLTISSTSGGFSGQSARLSNAAAGDDGYKTALNNYIGLPSTGLQNGWFTKGTTKSYSFSNLDPDTTYDFYFPAPIGTYKDLLIELYNGTELLGQVNAKGISLAISRAKITDISAVIDFSKCHAYTLSDVLGTYEMTEATSGSYSSNHEPGDIVLEASDDASKGNIMMTKFAGVSGKQYGTFDGWYIVFPKDQIFGDNPYSDSADKPYVALDFFKGSVVDATFLVTGKGRIKAVKADAMGFRTCTQEDWSNNHGGGWPWALCYGSLAAEWKTDYVEVPLDASMIYACSNCSWDGSGGVPALVDNDPATFWHSEYYYGFTTNSPIYGIYFDITLTDPVDVFRFKYQVRANAGAKPTHVVYGVSDDGTTWTKLPDQCYDTNMTSAAAGDWVTLPRVTLSKPYKYIRFGIVDSNNTSAGSLTGDLSANGYKKCVNMAELKLFKAE